MGRKGKKEETFSCRGPLERNPLSPCVCESYLMDCSSASSSAMKIELCIKSSIVSGNSTSGLVPLWFDQWWKSPQIKISLSLSSIYCCWTGYALLLLNTLLLPWLRHPRRSSLYNSVPSTFPICRFLWPTTTCIKSFHNLVPFPSINIC